MNIVCGRRGKKRGILGGLAEGGVRDGGGSGRWEEGGRRSGARGSEKTSTSAPPPLPPPPPSLPVDLNTVHVTNMAQLHSFVFEDCQKSYFNSIQDADSTSTGSLLTTVVTLISLRSSSCPLVVCGKNFEDHLDFIHVSNAQNPVYGLKVNEFCFH